MEFPDPDDLLNFRVIICPDEVLYSCTVCFAKLVHEVSSFVNVVHGVF